jgi:hypothetical protein
MSIIQCYVEAIYEKEAADILEYQKKFAKRLIENALGLPEGELHIPV